MDTRQLRPLLGLINIEKYHYHLEELAKANPGASLQLLISSQGGIFPIALSFFDVLVSGRYELTTIGSGQLTCAAIIVWMAGTRRELTRHTFVCFREIYADINDVGLEFCGTKARADLREADERSFAEIVASRSLKKLAAEKVRSLMRNEAVLTPEEAVEIGLAHGIIE